MKCRRPMAVLGVAAAVTVSLPLGAAGAAGSAIVNGDFETDAVGSTTVTGWTFTNELVDLGVTSLGGCVSQDTSSYSTLRDYADNAEPIFAPVVGDDDELLVPGTTDEVWLDESGAVTTAGALGARQVFYGTVDLGDGDEAIDFYVVDGTDIYLISDVADLTGDNAFADGFEANVLPDYYSLPDPSARDDEAPAGLSPSFESATVDADTARDAGLAPPSRALELYSSMSGSPAGYVAHGPAVVSDPFTTSGDRTVTLDWAASGQSDDYHVLGYALDVDTCQQIEVLDSTGEQTAWQSASVALPAGGTYRFVFVAGTYDATWGGAAGAVLYVDNIRVVPTISGTGLDLEPLFGLGDPVANAPIQLTGGGLMPNSAWTAELHSTPVTLATGFTDSSGNFWMLSTLPPTVEPGQHKIILKGTAPDGSPREDIVWITVSASGTIGYVSLVGEEDDGSEPIATAVLAKTGFESPAAIAVGAGLLAVGGAAIVVARRSRRS
jgi:LPXTG-motif cell wall-anchored protein